jgi:hypothetical protein
MRPFVRASPKHVNGARRDGRTNNSVAFIINPSALDVTAMSDESREPRTKRRALAARESARKIVAGSGGQYRKRGGSVDRARLASFVVRVVVRITRVEVAGRSRAQSPIAADDRDCRVPFRERGARTLFGLARHLGLVRVERDSATRKLRAHARPSLTRARGGTVYDDEQAR